MKKLLAVLFVLAFVPISIAWSPVPVELDPITIWMPKEEYQFAELVVSRFIPGRTVYIQQYEGEENVFSIYKNDTGEWIELGIPGRPFNLTVCINGTLYEGMGDEPEIACTSVIGELDQGWYPIHIQSVPALCGLDEYDAFYLGLAEPGHYKIVYEYWAGTGCKGEPQTVEKEFDVV